jgi:hypothetical protein
MAQLAGRVPGDGRPGRPNECDAGALAAPRRYCPAKHPALLAERDFWVKLRTRCPQFCLREVTRRQLDRSAWLPAHIGRPRMSTTTASSHASSVQWLIESRPPSVTWSRPAPPQPNPPPLDLSEYEEDNAPIAAPNDRGIRISTVKALWAARPRPGLPNAQDWSSRLALAIIQALLGQRPILKPLAEMCPRMVRNLRTLVARSS